MNLSEMPIEEITWIDSNAMAGWASQEKYIEFANGPLEIKSVGYILLDSPTKVALVQSFTPDREDAMLDNMIVIPKVAIIHRNILSLMAPSEVSPVIDRDGK